MDLKKLHPPKWADRFLQWYCRPDLLEEIQGDAYELYFRMVEISKWKADVQFGWNVIRFFRLKNIRKKQHSMNDNQITIGMIKNILKVAFRNFLKQPGHSFLSVAGLSVSFIAAFLILLWIAHEYSYDQFHEQPNRIFKVLSHVESNSTLETYTVAAQGLDVSSIPEIVDHVSIIEGDRWPNEMCFKPNGKANDCIYQNGVYASENIFKAFTFPILAGEEKPFTKNASIAISQQMARRLFSTEDVIGKSLNIDGMFDVTITAVFNEIPSNSSLQFDFVMPLIIFQKLRGLSDDQVKSNFVTTFVRTGTDISSAALTEKLNQPPALPESLKADKLSYSAFPFTEWRLNSTFENGHSVGGRIEYVRLFAIIGILVVVMAIINYINLSTSRAVNRSKEIGIRKATGALRSGIIFQFISESFLVVFISCLVAVVATQLSLPFFNELVGEHISLQLISGWIPLYLLAFLLIAAFAAGVYPAFIMSSFQPSQVLKGQVVSGRSTPTYFRKALLITQLSMSIGIIIFSGVLFSQHTFISEMNLGYDREDMIRIEPTYKLLKKYDAFKNELLKIPSVKSISATNANPMSLNGHTTGISWPGKPTDKNVTFQQFGSSYEFPETFGLQLVQGRLFKSTSLDSINTEALVSEEAVRVMDLKQPIGEHITIGDASVVIIGVIKDFHTESLHNEKLPIVIYRQPLLSCSAIFVKYEHGTAHKSLEDIQSVYKEMEPDFTMKYWFQDDTFNSMYKTETIASRLISLFTVISLIIAIIGIVGLASFNIIKRKKEISLKRVFGAGTLTILATLIKEFILVIALSLLIATPLAWIASERWLSGYAYRIDIPWWLFAVTPGVIFFLTVSIICLQALKTIATNPTQVLRSE